MNVLDTWGECDAVALIESSKTSTPVLEFLNNLWGLEPRRNRVVVPPPEFIGWRNRFYKIDSWAP
jgi:hypothetical protein